MSFLRKSYQMPWGKHPSQSFKVEVGQVWSTIIDTKLVADIHISPTTGMLAAYDHFGLIITYLTSDQKVAYFPGLEFQGWFCSRCQNVCNQQCQFKLDYES